MDVKRRRSRRSSPVQGSQFAAVDDSSSTAVEAPLLGSSGAAGEVETVPPTVSLPGPTTQEEQGSGVPVVTPGATDNTRT